MKAELFNDNWTVSKRGGSVGLETQEGLRSVTLPYDAMVMQPRDENAQGSFRSGYYPNGVWEFKKRFFVPEDWASKKITLCFDGVYARSSVYLNGDYAGGHSYGYSRFYVDLDRLLKFGQENEINVIARSADDARWYSGCGIYRDVTLLTAGQSYFVPDGLRIATPQISGDEAMVAVTARVYNGKTFGKETLRVDAMILDGEGNTVARGSAPLTVDFAQSAAARLNIYLSNPHRWDVDDPTLYTCRLTLTKQDGTVLDETEDRFGVRSLQISPTKGLQLNGRTVKLRGACIHHDNGPLGAVSTDFVEERRIRKLKEAGFNAIRCAHNPAGQSLLHACDKLGMLVMDEAFDMWTQPKVNFDYAVDFDDHWQEDVDALVASAYNHPSVILYSIGNEIPETGSSGGAKYGRAIAERIKALDPSRPTLNSINGMMSVLSILEGLRNNSQAQEAEAQQGGGDINQQMTDLAEVMSQIMNLPVITYATEEAYADVDVAGYNYMDVRYEADRQTFPNRVICGTETYPPRIAKNWELIKRCDHVIGDFTWTGWDYLGEAGIGLVKYEQAPFEYGVSAPYPSLTAWCGDITVSGFRRPISYYREIVFGLRKAPYIAVQRPERFSQQSFTTPWSWSDSVSSWSFAGFEGKHILVEVYSDAEEVALGLNGELLCTLRPENGKAEFETVYRPGELKAVNLRDGKEAECFALRSARGEKKLVLRPEKTELTENDLLYVELSLEDEKGDLFVGENIKAAISVDGPAELLAFANDDPLTEENFFDSERSLFDGRALAILRPTGKGEIRVSAAAGTLVGVCSAVIR